MAELPTSFAQRETLVSLELTKGRLIYVSEDDFKDISWLVKLAILPTPISFRTKALYHRSGAADSATAGA
jgi:hypothetical protein